MTTKSQYFQFSVTAKGHHLLTVDKDRLSADYDALAKSVEQWEQTSSSPNLIVDLSAVKYMESGALGKFLALHKSLKAKGGSLILTGIEQDSQVRKALNTTALDSVFTLASSVDEAEQALTPMQPKEIITEPRFNLKQQEDGVFVLTFAEGRFLDEEISNTFRAQMKSWCETLQPDSQPKLIIDMEKVEYFSSSFLGTMLITGRKIADTKGIAVISGASGPNVEEHFKITGAGKWFKFRDTMEHANQRVANSRTQAGTAHSL